MHVILTHEQADFDAVASLLGAALLYPDAVPVLPQRINRNVRAFLNLYASVLPFSTIEELKNEKIDRVTLVDTQSLMSMKGVTKVTTVHVIDHHDKKRDFPTSWSHELHHYGANTTFLVQKITESGIVLSSLHATLLLLGIYEDTGSFSYKCTTQTDLLVSGILVNKNADIQAVSKFLNPPLSTEQQALMKELLEHATVHVLRGNRVIIAQTTAYDLTDEISSVAHKMRDYLDPDGLFLIIRTREGIRLIARSTSNQINVAAVLKAFGGGGHERAAAALIKQKSGHDFEEIAEIKKKVLSALNNHIKTSQSIKKIMSIHPKLLSPSMKVSEALKLMIRYGYEGFPVVEKDKVIGLLSRKAVDRAIQHKMELPVRSLMEAGSVSINETDDIHRLQVVMSESGWGQIPVIDPKTGHISGIVTRTDLLKIMLMKNHSTTMTSCKNNIQNQLSPTQKRLLELVAKKATSLQIPTYIVGGFVRDLLLKMPVIDFDIVLEGDAISFSKDLASEYGGKITSHSRFGTARWDLGNAGLYQNIAIPDENITNEQAPSSIDFISARTEYYTHPTALPNVEKSSIRMDLQRRDFSINCLAIRLDGVHYGELVDHFNGLQDLQKKEIRILHPLSFVDDPTRILRAFRFAVRFNFVIESRTAELMVEAKDLLRTLSGSRIKHEVDQILLEKDPSTVLDHLAKGGYLESIHPDMVWDESIKDTINMFLQSDVHRDWQIPPKIGAMERQIYISYLIWLSFLPLESSIKISRRLRLPSVINKLLNTIIKSQDELYRFNEYQPGVLCQRFDQMNPIAIYVLYVKSHDTPLQKYVLRYVEVWSKQKTSLNGNDLIKMGMKQGPEIKHVLDAIRYKKIDGDLPSAQDEIDFARYLISKDQKK